MFLKTFGVRSQYPTLPSRLLNCHYSTPRAPLYWCVVTCWKRCFREVLCVKQPRDGGCGPVTSTGYRVKLDFDREGTEPGYGYLWLRMAKPYAGDTYGWHTPLIDGTEVAIAYSNGDIDLPYRMSTAR